MRANPMLKLAAVLFTSTALQTPVLAQSVPQAAPVFKAIDENGVDLALGTFNYEITPISIGKAADGLVASFSPIQNTFWSFSPIYPYIGSVTVSGAAVTVTLGHTTKTFTQSDTSKNLWRPTA